MNWRRENEQSTDRASDFARVVFPTPGKSSMIRWPSESRQRTANSSVSSGAWMTRLRLAVIFWASDAAFGRLHTLLRFDGLLVHLHPSQQSLDFVEDSHSAFLLAPPAHGPLACQA